MINYLKNNKGFMALEATIAFTVVLLLVFTMIAFKFIL